MAMTDLPPAGESPPTAMGQMPPDQEGMTVGQHLQAALALIGGDRQLTPDEMFEVRAFLEGVAGIARGRQANGQAPMGAPEQQGRPEEVQEGEYMGHAGTMNQSGY